MCVCDVMCCAYDVIILCEASITTEQCIICCDDVVWCGVVWCGVVWCGVVWCGVVWCGMVWCGVVWSGVVWWYGVVWCGVVWCGVVWCGVVWCGVVWCGVVWCGVAWCGVMWCGVVLVLNISVVPLHAPCRLSAQICVLLCIRRWSMRLFSGCFRIDVDACLHDWHVFVSCFPHA
jgi:hypothetical protein